MLCFISVPYIWNQSTKCWTLFAFSSQWVLQYFPPCKKTDPLEKAFFFSCRSVDSETDFAPALFQKYQCSTGIRQVNNDTQPYYCNSRDALYVVIFTHYSASVFDEKYRSPPSRRMMSNCCYIIPLNKSRHTVASHRHFILKVNPLALCCCLHHLICLPQSRVINLF